MTQDISWKAFFSDDERYADIINGIGFNGRRAVAAGDLQELDTQTGFVHGPKFIRRAMTKHTKVKTRDMVRRTAFGTNYVVVGYESQETMDYSIPLRNMSYDVGEYEKQAAKIRKQVRKETKGLRKGEYLYGFRKENYLHPTVTIILYSGEEAWDGPRSLHDMLDFTDIPEEIRDMVPDYRINLIEIRQLKDTSVFKTDVRQVFDFIRHSKDKDALRELIQNDAGFKSVEQDAFDVMMHYGNVRELVKVKEYYMEEGKIDMSSAITLLIEEGEARGIIKGRTEGQDEKTRMVVQNMLARNMSMQDICAIAECSEQLVKEVKRQMKVLKHTK